MNKRFKESVVGIAGQSIFSLSQSKLEDRELVVVVMMLNWR